MNGCRGIDPNFLVLNKKSAWEEGVADDSLEISDEGLRIAKIRTHINEGIISADDLSNIPGVTDFALGQCELLYILDNYVSDGLPQKRVWVYDPNQKQFEKIDCIENYFTNPVALIYRPGTIYIADSEAKQRIFAFAELNWQVRWSVGSTFKTIENEIEITVNNFLPVDLAVDNTGHLFALDGENKRIVKFDPGGRPVLAFGHNELEEKEPIVIAFSPQGFLYVLDAADKKVLKYTEDGVLEDADFIDITGEDVNIVPAYLAVDKKDNIYIGDIQPLEAGEAQEEVRFIWIFDASAENPAKLPGYRGRADKLIVDKTDRIYIFNSEAKTITILKPETRLVKKSGALLPRGIYFSKALDSTELQTHWHKLVQESEIVENTQILVSYFVSDEKTVAIEGDLVDLDNLLPRNGGSRETALEKFEMLDWSDPIISAADALFRTSDSTGRYLWLRIELIGKDQQSPLLKNIRAIFPRGSYLRYMPAVYQEDPQSRDFLERFLSIFETLMTNLEVNIDHITRYFDADSVNGGFLHWLASWVAVAGDESWSEAQLRRLLKLAPVLFKKRGTRQGLEMLIEIITGEKPLIIENSQLQDCGQFDTDIREVLKGLFGEDPYCFCVLLKPFPIKIENGRESHRRIRESERLAVKRIVEQEKPAHTCAGLKVLQPRLFLDMHTYLEINTYLAEPEARLESGAAIPWDAVLADVDEAGQAERRSRIGMDTQLT